MLVKYIGNRAGHLELDLECQEHQEIQRERRREGGGLLFAPNIWSIFYAIQRLDHSATGLVKLFIWIPTLFDYVYTTN